MANSNPKPLPSGISLGDIVYVLFKHKWKIILCALLCAAGAGAYYWKAKPPFVSDAKIMIRYLVDNSVEDDIKTKVGTGTGRQMDGVVDGQLAIVTSWDLAHTAAQQVAADLAGLKLTEEKPQSDSPLASAQLDANDQAANAPELKLSPEQEARLQRAYIQLLADDFEPVPRHITEVTAWLRSAAATAILLHLTATAEPGTAVIQLSFRHREEAVPQLVLRHLIAAYKVKHLDIHRPPPTALALNMAEEDAKSDQVEANKKLQEQLTKLNISSIAEGQQLYALGLASAQAELERVKSDLAEQETRVKEIERNTGVVSAASEQNKGNAPEAGESPAENNKSESGVPSMTAQNTKESPPAIDSVIMNNYRELLQSLSMARQQHSLDAMKFVPGSEGLKARYRLVQELEAKRLAMERANPELAAAAPAVQSGSPVTPAMDLAAQKVELTALKVRHDAALKRYNDLSRDAKSFSEALPLLLSYQQQLEISQENFKSAKVQQQQWGMDALLQNKKSTPNIRDVQAPTPSIKDVRMRNRVAIGLLAGGPALGVGLALLFGLLLNRSIKRPSEIEEGLGMPLMMSIPYFNKRQRMKSLRPMGGGKTTKALQEMESGRAPWDKAHFIQPYTEAVRDRLMMYFEATGNIRKPKLIAVTGYSVGAGTSTVAAGLASSLSEIGEGKVLLVDMSGSQGAAHPFFGGEPAVSLTKALRLPAPGGSAAGMEPGSPSNLVIARAESPAAGISSIGLRRLMPELKASEFDYIVFDMPPLGQTRPTATVAGMMDKVLVIVEAEANSRSDVRRGYRDLVQAGANMSVLFNKARKHGPKALAGTVA